MNKAFDKLKQDITASAGLGSAESTGFYAVKCHSCNNSRTTGGWKFEHDKIGYNCFRASCGASTVYEEGKPVPKKFRELCNILGVKIEPKLLMVRNSIQQEIESLNNDLYKKHDLKRIELPAGVVALSEASNAVIKTTTAYYESRHCNTADVYYAEGGDYKGLFATGIRTFGKLTALQFVTKKGTYVNYLDGNSAVLYTPEQNIPQTVIVVEGTFDAKCFPNTVAIMKSKITPEQAYHLRGKDVIMLPDKTGNSFIDQFSQYDWKISLPDWDAKDLNEAVQKYGIITASRLLMQGVMTSKLSAQTKYRMWVCQKTASTKNKSY